MNLLLVWDENPAIVNYIIRFKLHSSPIWTSAGMTSDSYIIIPGLIDCTAYDFEITPMCGPIPGTPTVTSNVFVDANQQCNPNAMFTLTLTNVSSGDPVDISMVSCDLGTTTTTGMPVHMGGTFTQIMFLYAWTTINYNLHVSYLGGYSTFIVRAYRNSILEYTSPRMSGGVGSPGWIVPICLLHPPAVGDVIEFTINGM